VLLLVILGGCRAPASTQDDAAEPPVAHEVSVVVEAEPAAAPVPSYEVLFDDCLAKQRAKSGNVSDADIAELCKRFTTVEHGRLTCMAAIDIPEQREACRYYPIHELPKPSRVAAAALAEIARRQRSFFETDHRHPDWRDATRGCAPAGSLAGDTDFVPPLAFECAHGPDGQCMPAANPNQPWEYPDQQFGPGTPWHALGFAPVGEQRRFHYRLSWQNQASPKPGACMFELEASGDLDGDGEHSSLRIGFAIDHYGMNADTLMRIEHPNE
jgi:hypothetical protein